jgi:hypothetical protein
MATRKTTQPQTSASGALNVDSFPAATRNTTKLSPFTDDVADMVDNGAMKFYPEVLTEEDASKLGNSLRSLAKRLHDNSALQVVFVPKPTPTHPAGVYVRCTGKITPKPRKATTTITPEAKAAVRKARDSRR